jgi:hypothetical protein
VALTVGRGARVDRGGSVVVNFELGCLLLGINTARDLDVHADADTELLGIA